MDLRESMYVCMRDSAKVFFAKVCEYNLPRNFSASKLLWYTVLFYTAQNFGSGGFADPKYFYLPINFIADDLQC